MLLSFFIFISSIDLVLLDLDNQVLSTKVVSKPLAAWGTKPEATKSAPVLSTMPQGQAKEVESQEKPSSFKTSPHSQNQSKERGRPNSQLSGSKEANLDMPTEKDLVLSNGGNMEDDRDKDDVEEVRMMHDQIEKSFLAPDQASVPEVQPQDMQGQSNLKPADLWVNKWVDYSNKYGLGYLLSNGNTGVYFNDSSKLILHKNGFTFEHIPRRASSSSSSSTPTREKLDLDHYPSSLQKKVTLLKHFRNYLLQHNKQDENNNANIGNSNANPPIEKQIENSQTDMMDLCSGDDENNRPEKMVYVKKWLRTKHAILFRLSDRTVQVIFYDHTEVILSSEDRMVTYTNKEKQRKTYPLQTVFQNPKPDLAKRMKYIKDILFHLLSHKPRV